MRIWRPSMALIHTNHRCFADVETQYNTTPVIRSKFGKANDIRPIGDRRRKHERIHKINGNCYAIMQGYGYGDPVFQPWYGGGRVKPSVNSTEQFAALVWRRHRDGTDTVKIANGSGPHGHHNSIYDMLTRHLPYPLRFVNKNGKHFIRIRGVRWSQPHDVEYYLAKRTSVPAPIKKHWDAYYRRANAQSVYIRERQGWMTAKDDGAALVFRRIGEEQWVHDSGGLPLPPAPRVNKELKDKYKTHMNEFYDWGITMTPLLPLETGAYNYGERGKLDKYRREHYGNSKRRALWLRDVLKDPEHPMRVSAWVDFATSFIEHSGWYDRTTIKEHMQEGNMAEVRSKFNSWVNKTAKFMK
jgi:hypothetical protein